MSVSNLGSCTFLDACTPVKGKSEWGMDTLNRKLTGARSLLETFIATLAQGQVYQDYFLQGWEADENPDVATLVLHYKGLQTGGTPIPDVQREVVSAVGNMSKSFSTENDGRGRIYAKVPLWKYSYSTIPSSGVFEDETAGTRDVYATSATIEFTYNARQTRYRYINEGEPAAPKYTTIGVDPTPTLEIERGRITTSDGANLGLPYASVFGLTPVEEENVISFTARNVIGSPFWECEDIVRLELVAPL